MSRAYAPWNEVLEHESAAYARENNWLMRQSSAYAAGNDMLAHESTAYARENNWLMHQSSAYAPGNDVLVHESTAYARENSVLMRDRIGCTYERDAMTSVRAGRPRWVVALLAAACTSPSPSASGSALSGVNGAAPISALSESDKQALCNWLAQQFGGYHSRGVCADSATGGLQGPVDLSGCLDLLMDYAHCSSPVSLFETCIQQETAGACNGPPTAASAPACATYHASCATADAGGQ